MSIISTCLIEKNIYYGNGLRDVLANKNFSIDWIYKDWGSAEECFTEMKNVALFILHIKNNRQDINVPINTLKARFPSCRIIILTEKLERFSAISAFSAGAEGYFSQDISPQSLLGSLDMIMAGEKICPAEILDAPTQTLSGKPDSQNCLSEHHLSDRETEVLGLLPGGSSNKEIARNLNITEATVKVHVKTVLRKLDLSNRTQAAVWAVNNGLNNEKKTNHYLPASL